MVDNKDIKDYKLRSLRGMMGIVTQETILLNTSIWQNICYGSNFNEKRLVEASEGANVVEFIDSLEDRYDTLVGERGVKLSGGQQQRIAIARAIYKNPSLLLLDEATSALDTESEKKVQKAIEMLMKDRTALVIAHRLSTVQNADKIIVLNQGKLIESGTHKSLISEDGHYKNLYEIQFGAVPSK